MTASFNQAIIEEFRARQGRVGGPFEGSRLILLTTAGAVSGAEHTVPLGRVRDGDALLVVASAGGAPRHPDWYRNLLVHPMVRVETGTETYGAVAVPAQGARRERLFARVVREAPGYADYQQRTTRTLPVVVLERSEPAAGESRQFSGLAGKLLEVHAWLRGQLRHVREEAEAYFAARAASEGAGASASPPGLGLQLRQHCLAFCQSLEFHHGSEDAHLLPALATAHPHLAGALERLRTEHRTIARLQARLLDLLSAIEAAKDVEFLAQLDALSAELTAHLEYEERELLPVLAEIPVPAGE
ncbi:nitroreductase/quinone reductase family protein [Streptomyces sp. ODS28]|uniref:nitroreductase/quinone reductase family protein n=1 Tax=Streptomyces sp. ODS28 TaxID=3136688 RepID=UPI0031EAFCC1